ncbi:unnamed protein product, partial [Prorocentrum cordatum]
MGREAHNLRRRQKLILKHTGKAYEPWAQHGGRSSAGAWRQEGAGSWEQGAAWRAPRRAAEGSWTGWAAGGRTGREPRQRSAVGSKRSAMLEDMRRLAFGEETLPKQGGRPPAGKKKKKSTSARRAASAALAAAPAGRKTLRPVSKASETEPGLRKKAPRRSKASETEPGLRRKKKKPLCKSQTTKTEPVLRKRKTTRKAAAMQEPEPKHSGRPKRATEDGADGVPERLSRRQQRVAKLLERKKQRRTAYVINPGSVTDRFSRGLHNFCTASPLTGEEHRLLASGGLSWRWLRDGDEPELLPRPPVGDRDAHRSELAARDAAAAR